jgi:hypothetical protein
MKEQVKKINLAFDINKELQKQISNSKYIKYAVYSVSAIAGILALGFLAKVVNYSVNNFKNLNATLKR